MIRLYGLILYLYPAAFRRAHGRDMLQFVRTAEREQLPGVRVRLVADLLHSLPKEWFEALRPRRFRRRQASPVFRPPGEIIMASWLRDIQYSARLLLRSPGFTAAAVLTLALGIGANTAIFSLAQATLLRPLDVSDPERLVTFTWSSSYPDFKEYQDRHDVFSGTMGVSSGARISVAIDGATELRSAAFVSGNTFEVLGVSMAAGRSLQPADDVPNGPGVAVLSHDFWTARFGGRADALGKVVHANGRPITIVGVAREGFRGTSLFSNPQIYIPIALVSRIRTGMFERSNMLEQRNFVWLNVIGRLQSTATIEQASEAIDIHYRRQHPAEPGENMARLKLIPLTTRALGSGADDIRRFVLLLGGVVALTLLIGCANLANLLLARSASRRREVGVRLALGAGRGRVVRQMLAESLLLSLAGGAAGVVVAAGLLRLLGAYQLPGGIDIEELGLGVDRFALMGTAALAIATGLLFGAAPAWRASRTEVMDSLRDGSRGASARTGLRSTLVAAQVALSLVLLTGSGLFLRSLVHALEVPLGFSPEGAITASVNVGLARYDDARAREFYAAALQRIEALPQVTAAGWSTVIPTNGNMMFTAEVSDYRPASDERIMFNSSQAGPGYFTAAGTRLLEGRAFTEADDVSALPVAIVNEAAAAKFWPRGPIGQRIKTGGDVWFTVVGVAENTKVDELREIPVPYMYFPFDQRMKGGFSIEGAHLFVRGTGDPAVLLPLVAEQIRAVDAAVPLFDVRPFDEAVRGLVMPQRMGVALLGLFSLLAVALAAVGIYGVASYVAALRIREVGIRMALGAGRGEIGSLMLREGARPVAFGILAGVGLAFFASRLAAAFLYGVSPHDPLTFGAVALLLGMIALTAAYIPARRAARVDPVIALRHE